MSCIKENGEVDPSKCSVLAQWKPHFSLEVLLTELRKEMGSPANRKTTQPPEGTTYN
jgi:ubiquitin-conjugating enzyme E2 variant